MIDEHDEGKSPEYIKRRDLLLDKMKKTRWDLDEEKPLCKKRGAKPKVKNQPKIDTTKPRNNFFNYD